MREASLRRYFLRTMRGIGALVYKLTPIGRKNKPDELVMGPYGQAVLVELKKPGEEPTDGQRREHERLRKRDHHIEVIDNKDDVDEFARRLGIRWYRN